MPTHANTNDFGLSNIHNDDSIYMHPACLPGESRDDDQQVPDFRPTSLALSAKGARLPRR